MVRFFRSGLLDAYTLNFGYTHLPLCRAWLSAKPYDAGRRGLIVASIVRQGSIGHISASAFHARGSP